MGKRARRGSRRSLPAVLCRILGTLMLIVLVLFCLPLTLPRVWGWHIYTVVSGSMEPYIPTGSLLYIRQAQPEDMAEGDVIAYYGGTGSGAVITHRVVENRVVMGEFITKGDANQEADINPVRYADFIGQVAYSIPEAGKAAAFFTSAAGKRTAGYLVAAAVLLHLLAALFDRGKEGAG